jgi:hypothetical protein
VRTMAAQRNLREARQILRSKRSEVLRDQTHRKRVYRPLQFHKRSQYFIRADDETLSVAMRVYNPDCSAFKVNC